MTTDWTACVQIEPEPALFQTFDKCRILLNDILTLSTAAPEAWTPEGHPRTFHFERAFRSRCTSRRGTSFHHFLMCSLYLPHGNPPGVTPLLTPSDARASNPFFFFFFLSFLAWRLRLRFDRTVCRAADQAFGRAFFLCFWFYYSTRNCICL